VASDSRPFQSAVDGLTAGYDGGMGRRRYQFSLSALMVLVTIVAVCFAYPTYASVAIIFALPILVIIFLRLHLANPYIDWFDYIAEMVRKFWTSD
jgi:hypothetical protein